MHLVVRSVSHPVLNMPGGIHNAIAGLSNRTRPGVPTYMDPEAAEMSCPKSWVCQS